MNTGWEMNAFGIIKAGGPLMLPILLCSFFAVLIIVEKALYFSSIRINISQFKQKIFDLVQNNKIKEAIQACEGNPSPVAAILKSGLSKFGSNRETIKEAIQDASLFEIPPMERRLNGLTTIAHITPLLGLLGTVIGLLTCFHTIQIRASALNPVTPADLAGGIVQALITTISGLLIAIPAYLAYNYYVNQVNDLALEMERAAAELVNLMSSITEIGQTAQKEGEE